MTIKKFITDNGGDHVFTRSDTGEEFRLERYGVWGEAGRGKPEVLEVSDDLEHLQRAHGPDLDVFRFNEAHSDDA